MNNFYVVPFGGNLMIPVKSFDYMTYKYKKGLTIGTDATLDTLYKRSRKEYYEELISLETENILIWTIHVTNKNFFKTDLGYVLKLDKDSEIDFIDGEFWI